MYSVGDEFVSAYPGIETHVRIVEVKDVTGRHVTGKKRKKSVYEYRFINLLIRESTWLKAHIADRLKYFSMSEKSVAEMLKKGEWLKK